MCLCVGVSSFSCVLFEAFRWWSCELHVAFPFLRRCVCVRVCCSVASLSPPSLFRAFLFLGGELCLFRSCCVVAVAGGVTNALFLFLPVLAPSVLTRMLLCQLSGYDLLFYLSLLRPYQACHTHSLSHPLVPTRCSSSSLYSRFGHRQETVVKDARAHARFSLSRSFLFPLSHLKTGKGRKRNRGRERERVTFPLFKLFCVDTSGPWQAVSRLGVI